MTIKGKGRTKGRQVARAPRRAPVEVAPPLFQRRWIQVVAAFVLGVLVMTFFVWVTNGLRANDTEQQVADAASKRLAAAQSYKTAIEATMGGVGVVNPGVPPTVLPDMGTTLQTMAKGKSPKDAAKVFEQAKKSAGDAQDAIATYEVGTKIRDQGFNSLEATAFTSSSQELIQALQLYGKAAEVGRAAAGATGAEAERLAGVAQDLYETAQAQLAQAWTDYVTALRTGGIAEQPPGPIPGLPGGGA
jgi:hypothetical protein